MFPARAGMSRRCMGSVIGRLRFPRVSGDEPKQLKEEGKDHEFSPRERG